VREDTGMSEEEKKTRLYEDLFDSLEKDFGQVRPSRIAIRIGDRYYWDGQVYENEELFKQAAAETNFEGPGPGVIVIRCYRDPSAPLIPKGHPYGKR